MKLAHQALKNGRMLRIDRVDIHAPFGGHARDEIARYHQRFFVGQGNGFSGFDGLDRWEQAGVAHHRCQHHIHAVHLHHLRNRIQP